MPIIIPKELPAAAILQHNILLLQQERAIKQRNSPFENCDRQLDAAKNHYRKSIVAAFVPKSLQIEVTLLKMQQHESKKILASTHLDKFYVAFKAVSEERFDALIITGAPVEKMLPLK